MNVLILNQYALPKGAAGITRHGDIGAELVRRGHEVTVIASAFDYFSRAQRDRPRRSTHDGVKFVWLKTSTYVRNDQRRVRSMGQFATSATFAAIRSRPRPHVIVGSSPHLLTPLAASSAARLLGRPWIFEVRDFWPSSLVDLGALRVGSRAHKALESLERRLYRRADAVVSVPPRGHERLAEVAVAPKDFEHIPNSTDSERPADTTLPPTLAAALQSLGERLVIVYAGAMGVAQELPVVLDGLADLRADQPAVHDSIGLLLVGDGVEKAAAEAKARELGLDSLRFHGPVEKTVVSSLLERADACLLPLASADVFKYGLSPNKLFDYFAAAKPVLIAADYPTVVDEAGAGVRYRPGDARAFADAIAHVAALSPEERAATGERGRELARTRYSVTAVADQYEELLQRVVARHRSR